MKIAIIGCGNMGKAIAKALSSHKLFLYDRNKEKREPLNFGIPCETLNEAIEQAEMIILAIKPKDLTGFALKENQTLVSLLAGVPLSKLKSFFPKASIIRMMPNLALALGEGVIGLSTEDEVQKEQFTALFSSLGKVYWLTDDKMDALTSLTGSGPAFFCEMIESIIDAGIAMGFSKEVARDLSFQMVKGSLALLENQHPSELKSKVASPGGTTVAGLKKWEEKSLKDSIIQTFLAAYERAKEISGV